MFDIDTEEIWKSICDWISCSSILSESCWEITPHEYKYWSFRSLNHCLVSHICWQSVVMYFPPNNCAPWWFVIVTSIDVKWGFNSFPFSCCFSFCYMNVTHNYDDKDENESDRPSRDGWDIVRSGHPSASDGRSRTDVSDGWSFIVRTSNGTSLGQSMVIFSSTFVQSGGHWKRHGQNRWQSIVIMSQQMCKRCQQMMTKRMWITVGSTEHVKNASNRSMTN